LIRNNLRIFILLITGFYYQVTYLMTIKQNALFMERNVSFYYKNIIWQITLVQITLGISLILKTSKFSKISNRAKIWSGTKKIMHLLSNVCFLYHSSESSEILEGTTCFFGWFLPFKIYQLQRFIWMVRIRALTVLAFLYFWCTLIL
jgi:hypothetical protein